MDGFEEASFGRKQPLGEAIETAAKGSRLQGMLLDELAHGVVLTTRQRRILHANPMARAELDRAQFLQANGDLLSCADDSDLHRLSEAMALAVSGERSLCTLVDEFRSLSVAVLPVGTWPDPEFRIALVFSRPMVQSPGILGLFARTHGLTSTEEHVLALLCQGLTNPEVAAQMKVAVSTIRSHVRSLSLKTRSRGVRELVNRVAVLPPVGFCFSNDRVH